MEGHNLILDILNDSVKLKSILPEERAVLTDEYQLIFWEQHGTDTKSYIHHQINKDFVDFLGQHTSGLQDQLHWLK